MLRSAIYALALVALSACGAAERLTGSEPGGCDREMTNLVQTRGATAGIGGVAPNGWAWHRLEYNDATYFFEWGTGVSGCKVTITPR